MPVEICRKIKVLKFIVMFVLAQVRQVEARSNEVVMMALNRLLDQTQRFAEQVQVMMADPTSLYHSKNVVEEMLVLMKDAKFQERRNRITKEMQAMKAHPKVKYVAAGMEAMIADPSSEHVKHAVEQMESLMLDSKFQEEARQVAKRITVMTHDSKFQEQASRITGHMEAMMSNPEVQRQAKRVAEEIEVAMIASAAFQDQPERMRARPILEQQANFDEVDTLVNKMVDKMFGRAIMTLSLRHTYMDRATLGSPARVVASRAISSLWSIHRQQFCSKKWFQCVQHSAGLSAVLAESDESPENAAARPIEERGDSKLKPKLDQVAARADSARPRGRFVALRSFVRDRTQSSFERATAITPKRVAELSAMVNALLSAFKVGVGNVAGSTALVADGVHSFSDLIADAICWASVQIGARPADAFHPEGYGRYEHIGTIGIAAMVIATGVALTTHSAGALVSVLHSVAPAPPSVVELAPLLVASASVLSKELLFRITLLVGKRSNSHSTVANAYHHRTDVLSSLVAFVGIAGALMGCNWFDPLAATAVGIMMAKMGIELGQDSAKALVEDITRPGQNLRLSPA